MGAERRGGVEYARSYQNESGKPKAVAKCGRVGFPR